MRRMFYVRLHALGFLTYKDYLQSPYWDAAKRRYYDAGLPCQCLVCGSTSYVLHHRSYARIGCELPRDLVALCPSHHKQVHDYERNQKAKLKDLHTILRELYGWSRKETRMRFHPYCHPGTVKGFRWLSTQNDVASIEQSPMGHSGPGCPPDR